MLLASILSPCAVPAAAASKDIVLPTETAQLKPSALPGHAVAMQKCGICHSADYVDYQPPNMTLTQWTAEMAKMQKAYGAPLSDEEVKLLGVYLAAVYGDATTVSDADRALQPVAGASASAADGQALLSANGCLACHAVATKVVGPAYHDVATKYRGDPQAVARLATSIRDGSAGQWGPVPMPPFANLSTAEAETLATYVLRQ